MAVQAVIGLALGAGRRDILILVLRKGLVIVGVGVVLGLLLAFTMSRFLSDFLVGVSPTDPLTFITLSLILSGVALLRSYIPALRATKVDPMVALRYE